MASSLDNGVFFTLDLTGCHELTHMTTSADRFHHKCIKNLNIPFQVIRIQEEMKERSQLAIHRCGNNAYVPSLWLFRCMCYENERL